MLTRLEIARGARFIWIFALMMVASLAFGIGRAEAYTGLASWYGKEFAGDPTASGEPYDPYGYTAAHKTLPFGTDLEVRYKGRSVQVTVNDRDPYTGAGISISRKPQPRLSGLPGLALTTCSTQRSALEAMVEATAEVTPKIAGPKIARQTAGPRIAGAKIVRTVRTVPKIPATTPIEAIEVEVREAEDTEAGVAAPMWSDPATRCTRSPPSSGSR